MAEAPHRVARSASAKLADEVDDIGAEMVKTSSATGITLTPLIKRLVKVRDVLRSEKSFINAAPQADEAREASSFPAGHDAGGSPAESPVGVAPFCFDKEDNIPRDGRGLIDVRAAKEQDLERRRNAATPSRVTNNQSDDLALARGMLEGYMRQAAAHPEEVEKLIPAIGETLRRVAAFARSSTSFMERPKDFDAALERVDTLCREVQVLCDEFDIDPSEYLADDEAVMREKKLISALDKIQAMEWPAGSLSAGANKASEMYDIADQATSEYYEKAGTRSARAGDKP